MLHEFVEHADYFKFFAVKLHFRPDDLALIGVTGANAGQLVLDQATWEQRFGLSIRTLPFGGDLVFVLPAGVPTIPPESIPEGFNPEGPGAEPGVRLTGARARGTGPCPCPAYNPLR